MSDALPQLDPQTRTLKTRFELDNPGNILLPDMFVDVELAVDTPAAITVPADAVIDSGRRKTVYVERGNGVFEPRLVETGWRLGDRVQITQRPRTGRAHCRLRQLPDRFRKPHENARERQRCRAEKAKPVKDLVCGMDVDPKSPNTLKTQYKGETYYFCCEHCKKSFEANPEKYIPKKTAAAKVEKAKDLVCGMDVDPNSADVMKTQYKGKTYYFCSETVQEELRSESREICPEEWRLRTCTGCDMTE